MAASPEVTDDRLVLRDGIWCNPGDQRHERWSADAAVDPIHAALATTGVDAEHAKSRRDIEFLFEHAHDGILLDLGCGYGRIAKYLLPRRTFDSYVGIDGSMTMLRLFRERYQASRLERKTPLLLMHGSIDDIKLADASVDTVVIAAVLLHNPKAVTRTVVREARRVLRLGGRLIVLNDLPNSRTPAALPSRLYVMALELSGDGNRNGPVRTYSRSEVGALFAEFEDVRIRPKGHALLPKRIPGAPDSLSRRYRAFVHDPVLRWAKHRLPAPLLDRMYFNVCVMATR
jgi:SAM-dependent methyltransferase